MMEVVQRYIRVEGRAALANPATLLFLFPGLLYRWVMVFGTGERLYTGS